MIHIHFIEKHKLIAFSVVRDGVYKEASDDPRASEENKLLRKNLTNIGIKTEQHDITFEKREPSFWSIRAYHSGDFCFYVPANSFSSFKDIEEQALAGFTEFKVPRGAMFSDEDLKPFMYAFDMQTDLSPYKKQLLEQYYDNNNLTLQASYK